MALLKIFLATAAMGAVLQCPSGKKIKPNFSVEVVHLQDTTETNKDTLLEIGNTLSYVIEDLLETFPGMVMYGYGEFNDDASPDDNVDYNTRRCFRMTMQPRNIALGASLLWFSLSMRTYENYDVYNCGFKAMTLAMNTKPDSMVYWLSDTFKLLSLATDAPGKMVGDFLNCPDVTDFMDCPKVNMMASKQLDATENGEWMNTPTEEDAVKLAKENGDSMALVAVAVGNVDNSTGVDTYGWWDQYGLKVVREFMKTDLVKDYSMGGEYAKAITERVMWAACIDEA